jgi:hypothetical protein
LLEEPDVVYVDGNGNVWRVGSKTWLNWPGFQARQARLCLALSVSSRTAVGVFVRCDGGVKEEEHSRADTPLMLLQITPAMAKVRASVLVVFVVFVIV